MATVKSFSFISRSNISVATASITATSKTNVNDVNVAPAVTKIFVFKKPRRSFKGVQ